MKPPAGGTTAREATTTTRPYRARTIAGTTAFATLKALVRLRSSMRFQVSRSVSRSEPPANPPTPATRMSILPRAATTPSANAVIALRSITSVDCKMSRWRSAAGTRCVSRSRSASTAYGTATIAPSARSRRVTACPSAPVPPVTTATRAARTVMTYSAEEDILAELLEGLLERRQRLPRARERRRAREEVVFHVGVVDPTLLDLGDGAPERRVGGADHVGALRPRLDALRQGLLQELVDPAEDRREGAAREPLVLLVEEAERDEVRRLELRGPLLFGGLRILL